MVKPADPGNRCSRMKTHPRLTQKNWLLRYNTYRENTFRKKLFSVPERHKNQGPGTGPIKLK